MIRAGRVALVTGGGRGIGAAVALALAGEGARVVVTSRNSRELEGVAETIRSTGGTALALPADLRQSGVVEALRDEAERAFGPVELLVSNAAVVQPLGPVWTVPPEQFAAAVGTNLIAAQHLLHAFVPAMLAAGFGRIVAVSSSAARHPVASLGSYGAGKAGFDLLHAALALDLAGTGVRINRLWPGGTDTAMQSALRTTPTPLAEHSRRVMAAGLLRAAADVAPHVVRLLADDVSEHGALVDLGELSIAPHAPSTTKP